MYAFGSNLNAVNYQHAMRTGDDGLLEGMGGEAGHQNHVLTSKFKPNF